MRSILFLALIVSSNALGGSYTVTLREFGYNRGGCDRDIAAVASGFAEAAKVTILSSGCLPPTIGDIAFSGEFTYIAPIEVETFTSDVKKAWGIDGYYASLQECAQALASERDLFVSLTGLNPYVGYCYKANKIGAPRFRVRLDAIGQSNIQKQSVFASWAHRLSNPNDLVADVRLMIDSVGGTTVAAVVAPEVAGQRVSADFYSATEFHLHAQELLFWPTPAACELRAIDLSTNWPKEIVPSTFHCTTMPSGVSRLLQIYLSEKLLSGFDFDTKIYPSSYPSEAVCATDLVRLKSALEHTGTTVLGATCGQDDTLKVWRAGLFTLSES